MKQITFRELLNMIHEGEQPNKLTCYNVEWEWDSNDEEYYYRIFKNFNKVYTEDTTLEEVVSDIYTVKQLAEDKIIHLYGEILDDKEKSYLLHIIKPFKKYVKYIVKIEMKGQEKIRICYKDYLDKEKDSETLSNYTFFGLPTFKAGTMYRGMELNREYTLEELDL